MKSIFKSSISIILVLIMSVAMIAGCGAQTSGGKIRVGSLKGPTTIGLCKLMEDNKDDDSNYSFEMAVMPDEILSKLMSGELDVVLVPANVAAIAYNKFGSKVKVIDINTLGVLYGVSKDSGVATVSDLAGRTVYVIGKGTTPDYSLQYLLKANGLTLDDVNVEYKSEAAEVIALLMENSEAVGILPQPFVTAACAKDESMKTVLDLNELWENSGSSGGRMVTGVTLAGPGLLERSDKDIQAFIKAHKESADFAHSNLDETAKIVAELGIIEKEGVAKKAIPFCNVTCIDGDAMKDSLEGYYKVLFELDSASIGGKLPGEDFYY